MRSLVLACLLAGLPGAAIASEVRVQHLDARFSYGLVEKPFLYAYDLDGLDIRDPDRFFDYEDYLVDIEVTFADLDQLTFTRDAGGNVSSVRYEHRGVGELALALYRNEGRLPPLIGWFRAAVYGLTIDAWEGGGPEINYLLGRGSFDAPLAKFLGVGRRTTGGTGWSSMLAHHDTTSYLMPERHGWDGAGELEIVVPEPSAIALGAIAVGFALVRRRARVRTHAVRTSPLV